MRALTDDATTAIPTHEDELALVGARGQRFRTLAGLMFLIVGVGPVAREL
jgi:hypothetical protein